MTKKINKKIFSFSVVLATLLILVIIFWVVQINEKNNMCVVSVRNEKNEDSKGSEVRIFKICIGDEDIDLNEIATEKGFLYEDGQIVIYPYDMEKVFTFYSEGLKSVNIGFIVHPYSGYVHVKSIEEEKCFDLYSETDSRFEYCLTFSFFNALKNYFYNPYHIFFWILIYILIIIGLYILIKKCLPIINKLEFWNFYKGLKKIPLIFISLIIALMVFTNIILVFTAQEEDLKYVLQVNNEKNVNAKGSEVRITLIEIGGIKQDLANLAKENGFLYDSGYLIIYPYNGIKRLSLNVPRLSSLKINFLQHEWSGIVHLYGKDEHIIDLYSNKSEEKVFELKADIFSIIKEYIIQNWKLEIGIYFQITIISFLIFYFIICKILYIYYKMIKNKIKLKDIVVFAISIFILDFVSVFLCLEINTMFAFIIEICKLLFTTSYLKKNTERFLENAYLSIAVIAGCFIMLALPPGHVPDEMSHFSKSCVIASEDMAQKQDEKNVYLQRDIYNFFNKYTKNIHSLNYTVSAISYFEDMADKLDLEQNKVLHGGYTTDNLKALPYIPSAIILWITQYIGGIPIFIFYLSRFIDFLIALVLIFYSIRITPIFKRIFLIVALFPITLQQMGAINQDWLTNAVCILLIALIMSEVIKEEPIQRKNVFAIMGMGIILAYCKLAYYFILILVILIPSGRFKSKKSEVILKALMICPGLFLALAFTFSFAGNSLESNTLIENRYSLDYLISHPIKSLQVYLNTFNERGTLDLLGGLQTGFGWSIKWSYGFVRFILQVLSIFMIVLDNEKIEKKHFMMKIVLGAVFILEIGVIYSAAFTWTRIGGKTIEGLQSRYFIPIALIAYMLFNNQKLVFTSKYKNYVYVYVSLLILIIGISTIIFGYYI